MLSVFKEYSTTNKNKVNQFLITLPQWDQITDYKLWADTNLPPHQYLAICQETHENGGNHHHIVIHTTTKLTKPQLISRFTKLFPDKWKKIHITNIRKDTITHCVDYLKKEDPNVWTHGEIPKGGRPVKKTTLEYIARPPYVDIWSSNYTPGEMQHEEKWRDRHWEEYKKWQKDTLNIEYDTLTVKEQWKHRENYLRLIDYKWCPARTWDGLMY